MVYHYRYQDQRGLHDDGVVTASSLADAYSVLRKNGIRPMKVWEDAGAKTRTLRIRFAIGLLGAGVLLLVGVWMTRTIRIAAEVSDRVAQEGRRLAPLPRHRAVDGVVALTNVFAHRSGDTLLRYIVPGRMAEAELPDLTETFCADFRAALGEDFEKRDGETIEMLNTRRILVGIVNEAKMALAAGSSVEDVLEFLEGRQKMERSFRDNVIRELSMSADSVDLAKRVSDANATLRSMGLPMLTEQESPPAP